MKKRIVKGQVVIECIVGMIIFTMMLALIMSISVYLYFQQALVTSAREGAREAAMNSDLGTTKTQSAGISTIQSAVVTEIQSLTGQVYSSNFATITIVPPSQSPNQTPGQRLVGVNITWNMTNPVNVAGMITALGGNGKPFANIPVSASATMLYEE